jgi:hypothetical protein
MEICPNYEAEKLPKTISAKKEVNKFDSIFLIAKNEAQFELTFFKHIFFGKEKPKHLCYLCNFQKKSAPSK